MENRKRYHKWGWLIILWDVKKRKDIEVKQKDNAAIIGATQQPS